MRTDYDVIVVGARCAGSPTAMLLARSGHRVLLVDKATFPSDTMSTHLVHPPGVAALARWGLLEQLEATGCPPIAEYRYDFGPITIEGSPRPVAGVARAYCPRRTVLDKILVDAAAAAGAEVREAFTVEDVLVDDGRVVGIRGHARGGATLNEHAAVVVGADGKHSLVAKAVRAARYNELPTYGATYYAYWSGLGGDAAEIHIRAEHGRGWGVLPTHDGLDCVVMGWPRDQFDANRKDVEGTYMSSFDLIPEFAERIRGATRESRFVGTGDLPNYFVEPYGRGWALVGDAGYHKDPITAYGITDAFRDAEAVASAIDDTLAGRRRYDEAMAAYQRARDEQAVPVYGFTTEFAKLEPPPPESQAFLGAVAGDREAMDDFVSVMAGTLPAPEFFAPQYAERIMSRTAATRP
jgi:2-polyprenyl-6-methoxyphenol hydroxylase-like FAD-dependent oxidoreductase